jgi:hypothetical protein
MNRDHPNPGFSQVLPKVAAGEPSRLCRSLIPFGGRTKFAGSPDQDRTTGVSHLFHFAKRSLITRRREKWEMTGGTNIGAAYTTYSRLSHNGPGSK